MQEKLFLGKVLYQTNSIKEHLRKILRIREEDHFPLWMKCETEQKEEENYPTLKELIYETIIHPRQLVYYFYLQLVVFLFYFLVKFLWLFLYLY